MKVPVVLILDDSMVGMNESYWETVVYDLDGNSVAHSIVPGTVAEYSLGMYRFTLELPDSFAGGFLTVENNTPGPLEFYAMMEIAVPPGSRSIEIVETDATIESA
jgi:hypothetical protein